MGTIIESSHASPDVRQGYIAAAVSAARHCLARIGMHARDIDLLINIGVFRGENIVEPAIASLIQQRLGMNPDPVRSAHLRRTSFSFDINDGECGFLAAARVVDALFKSGAATHALIVSGDVHPSESDHPEFPFRSVVTAVLLASSEEEGRGFSSFHFKTSGNGHIGFSANVDLSKNGGSGRECMGFAMVDRYHDQLSGFTAEMMNELIASGEVHSADIDYIVTSQSRRGFGAQVARSLPLRGAPRVVDLYERYGDSHTSALPLSYHHLAGEGLLKKNDRILFIGSGSGMSAACSLYRV